MLARLDADRVAAGIWARATARRDGLPAVPSADDKLPGIRESLAREGASLLFAARGGRTSGFALVAPHGPALEVVYLAVDPECWGEGVGRELLASVGGAARESGHAVAELWVLADNDRAIRTYERAGWLDTGERAVRNAAGRLERRYVIDVGSPDLRTARPSGPATRSAPPATGSSR